MIKAVSTVCLMLSVGLTHTTYAQSAAPESPVTAAVTIMLARVAAGGESGASDANNAKGASDSPYCILIADHTNDRGHAPFGGTVESGENPRAAAAREAAEESRHVIKEGQLLKQLKTAPEVRIGSLVAYVVVTDPISVQDMEQAATTCDGCSERQGYTWIPVSVIDRIVASDDRKIPKRYRSTAANTDHLWSAFAGIYPKIKPLVHREM